MRKHHGVTMKVCMKLLTFLLFTNIAYAAKIEIISELQTSKGTLTIVQKREKPSSFADHSIELNGNEIIKSDSQKKKIVGAFPKKNPKYIVIQIITGGSGCPATYKVIDFTYSEPNINELFANCSDYIKTKYLSNGNIQLTVGGKIWVYSKGEFSEK